MNDSKEDMIREMEERHRNMPPPPPPYSGSSAVNRLHYFLNCGECPFVTQEDLELMEWFVSQGTTDKEIAKYVTKWQDSARSAGYYGTQNMAKATINALYELDYDKSGDKDGYKPVLPHLSTDERTVYIPIPNYMLPRKPIEEVCAVAINRRNRFLARKGVPVISNHEAVLALYNECRELRLSLPEYTDWSKWWGKSDDLDRDQEGMGRQQAPAIKIPHDEAYKQFVGRLRGKDEPIIGEPDPYEYTIVKAAAGTGTGDIIKCIQGYRQQYETEFADLAQENVVAYFTRLQMLCESLLSPMVFHDGFYAGSVEEINAALHGNRARGELELPTYHERIKFGGTSGPNTGRG